MIRKLLITTLLAGLGIFAQATGNEDAYEVEADFIQLPGGIAGSVIVRECATCEVHTLRVNAQTRYLVNESPTTLDRLKARHKNAKAEEAIYVVAYDIETKYVTWISLDI